jgi:hypothetical protein
MVSCTKPPKADAQPSILDRRLALEGERFEGVVSKLEARIMELEAHLSAVHVVKPVPKGKEGRIEGGRGGLNERVEGEGKEDSEGKEEREEMRGREAGRREERGEGGEEVEAVKIRCIIDGAGMASGHAPIGPDMALDVAEHLCGEITRVLGRWGGEMTVESACVDEYGEVEAVLQATGEGAGVQGMMLLEQWGDEVKKSPKPVFHRFAFAFAFAERRLWCSHSVLWIVTRLLESQDCDVID